MRGTPTFQPRSEEHTSELQSRLHLVCRLLLEKKKTACRPDRYGSPLRRGRAQRPGRRASPGDKSHRPLFLGARITPSPPRGFFFFFKQPAPPESSPPPPTRPFPP